jgi:TatD DNase family protein
MIDLHTHLDLYPNALDILARVNKVNQFTLAVTTSPRAWIATKQVFSSYENIKVALGLHPEIATEKFDELDMLLASVPQTDFIGEVGIDGSEQHANSIDKQEIIFDNTVRACQKYGGRIISIHSKGSASKVLSILKKYPDCGKPILHWFSGTFAELKEAIDMRCFFSVNPVMMKSKKGNELVSRIPASLVLPESDGPFTTKNKNPIMPWEAIDICACLSDIWNISIADAREQIINNAKILFNANNIIP